MNKKADQAPIKTLIERSSFGTRSARAARQTVSADHGRTIARMAAGREADAIRKKQK